LAGIGDDPQQLGEPFVGAAVAQFIGDPTDKGSQLALSQPVQRQLGRRVGPIGHG
jgi:hypothetical protein